MGEIELSHLVGGEEWNGSSLSCHVFFFLVDLVLAAAAAEFMGVESGCFAIHSSVIDRFK